MHFLLQANERKSKENRSMKWKHKPSMLIDGSVNYSTLVSGKLVKENL